MIISELTPSLRFHRRYTQRKPDLRARTEFHRASWEALHNHLATHDRRHGNISAAQRTEHGRGATVSNRAESHEYRYIRLVRHVSPRRRGSMMSLATR